jgi:hypothetical protein
LYAIRVADSVKATSIDNEGATRTKQSAGSRIGEQHPRGDIDQQYAPLQVPKPVRRGIVVAIADPEFAMNANGAVDVRQRGLEDIHLLSHYFIFPGYMGDGDQCRDFVTDEQISSHHR